MKFHPILFSTEMVKSILAGSKTMTRRILKVKGCKPFIPDKNLDIDTIMKWNKEYFPYGKVGDVLWVREASQCVGGDINGHDVEGGVWLYKADGEKSESHLDIYDHLGERRWKPSIHMPKTACRIFLKIKSIHVERLQDITEADAKAEGIEIMNPSKPSYKNYNTKFCNFHSPIHSFESLWQSINGVNSWQANPFVWAIKFERIEKPKNFF